MAIEINDENIKMFRAAQNKYQKDFVGFYKSLSGYFIGQKQIIKDITAARQNVEQVIKNIDEITTPLTDNIKEKSQKLFNDSMKAIENDLKFFDEQSKGDYELRNSIKLISEKSGRSLKALIQSQAQIRGRLTIAIRSPNRIARALTGSPTLNI